MLKIAVLGTGLIGSVHAKNVARHPGSELVAVYDVNVEFAKRAAATTGTKVAADVTEIFDNPEIQAVVIATPTNTHVEYLRRAAQTGKAIYCEKPIGLDYQEAQQAVAVVRVASVPAMLGFNRRFDPNHAALREEVKSGTVGSLEIIQMTSRGPSLPPISYLPTSGGQLRDQTVHFFDLLRWISEDEPEEIYVFGAALVDPKVAEVGDIDTSIVAIRLSRGTLCQIDCSRRTGYGYDERIEVFGSIEQSYYQALDAFVAAITKGLPPSPSLEDGLKAQLLADKATESLKSGQPVKFAK